MGDQVINSCRPIEQCVCVENVKGIKVTSSTVRDVRIWTLQAVSSRPISLLWSEKTTPTHLNTPGRNMALWDKSYNLIDNLQTTRHDITAVHLHRWGRTGGTSTYFSPHEGNAVWVICSLHSLVELSCSRLRGSRVRKDQQDERTQQSSGPHGRVSYAGGPRSGR